MKKDFEKYFQAVVKTPLLWTDSTQISLRQLQLFDNHAPLEYCSNSHPSHLRLGKQVEYFVEQYFDQHHAINIIDKNILIKRDKITIGELDFLIWHNNLPCHIEVVYKFYLYVPNSSNSEIDCWIGPNNNDSLKEKLHKLKNKQFPLLNKPETQSYLKQSKFHNLNIHQYTYFKGQLFLPYSLNIQVLELNRNCVVGYYLLEHELEEFSEALFYFPSKIDWLLQPNFDVEWLNYDIFLEQIKQAKSIKKAPLCWIKSKDNKLSKAFIYFPV